MAATEYSSNLGGALGFVADIAGRGLDYLTIERRAHAQTAAYQAAVNAEDARANRNAQAQANRTVQISRPIVIGAAAVAVLVLMLRG